MVHTIRTYGEHRRSAFTEARVIRPLDLATHAIATAGLSLIPAISHEFVGADKLWMGMTVLEGGSSTGPHHHGENETGVYLVAGRMRVKWGERLESEAELEVGDLLFIPPHLPHEVLNESIDEPAVWVVVFSDGKVYVPLEPDINGLYQPDPNGDF